MLRQADLQAMKTNPNTVEKRLIVKLYFTFAGACTIDDLVKAMPMIDKKALVNTHIRKSIYISYDSKTGIVRLERKGKDIYEYGKLYDNPFHAKSLGNFVFSVLYKDYNLTFEEVCGLVQKFCDRTQTPIGNFLIDKTNHYSYYKKLVKKWLTAKEN